MGAVIGTFNYMSPEQAMGKKPTPASDVFSLGILFYELLTGIKPFSSDKQDEVQDNIIHKNPKSVCRIHPGVPRSFGRIIKKCLRKNPKRRFQSTHEIKLKLEKFLKRYSLDHQAILKDFLDNLTSPPDDEKWPPNLASRIFHRLTHQRLKTYIIWLLIVMGIGYMQYRWISSGKNLKVQWNFLTRQVDIVWDRLNPSSDKKIPEPGNEIKPDARKDSTSTLPKDQ
jgi:serine/threonine protein kinase